MDKLELLLEAERRGILPPDKLAALNEARARGIIPGGAAPSAPRQTTRERLAAEALPGQVADSMANLKPFSVVDMLAQPGMPRPLQLDENKMRRDMMGDVGQGTAAAMAGLQGLTFGAGDEIIGGMNALAAPFQGRDMGEAYASGRDGARTALEVGREQNPLTSLGAELGGAVASPASLLSVGKLASAATPAARIGAGGLLGAFGGGVYGFNDSEGGAAERAQGGVLGALVGGGVGAALPAIGQAAGGLKRAKAQRAANAEFASRAPNSGELMKQADGFYDAFRQSGVTASADEVKQLASEVMDSLRASSIVTKGGKFLRPYKDASAAVEYLKDYTKTGMNAEDMLAFRSMVSDLAESRVKKVRKAMGGIKSKIDKFIEPKSGLAAKGHDAYASGMRTEALEKLDAKAADKGKRYFTQAGYPHALGLEYKNLLDKIRKGKVRGYSQEQIAAMQRVVDGSATEKAMMRISQVAPKNPMMAGVGNAMLAGAATQLGVPGGAIMASIPPLYAAGRVAGAASNKLARNNSALMQAMAATGQAPKQIPYDRGLGLLDRLMMTGGAIAPTGPQ